MASSGSFNTSSYNGRYLTLSWSIKSTDITNNKTTISWSLKGAGTAPVGYYEAGNFKVVISGTTVYSSSTRINLYNGTVVASGTLTLTHNSDGTRNFTASAEAGIYYYAVNCSGSGSFTLDTIPRKSSLSASNGTLGTAQTLTVNRKSSSFTHTITYKCGSASGTIATKSSSTSISWTPPLTLASQNTTGTSVSVTFTITTYSGSTSIGSNTKAITCAIPASVAPSCTATLEDVSAVDDIYGSPVQRLSRIKVTVNPTTAYGSPIAAYSITIDGTQYGSQTITTGALKKSGSSVVSVKVKDKRGRTGTWSYTMNVQSYTAPTITALNVHRCDANGTENPKGDYLSIGFSAAVTSLSSKNTATYTLRYKKSTDTTFTSVGLTALNNVYSVSGWKHSPLLTDSSSSYDIEVEAKDKHNVTGRNTSASTAFTLMNWGSNGTSVALGKVAEKANAFEVALDNYFYGTTIQTGNHFCASSRGTHGAHGFVRIARIAVTGTSADSPISFRLTRRKAATPMTVHVLFTNNQTATASDLSSITYTGTNYGAFLTKAGNLIWDLYIQKSNEFDTITLQDWWTSELMKGRVDVTFPGTQVTSVPQPWYRATPAKLESLLDYIYPVGSVYISYSHVSPADLFGGTWARIQNAFLWAVDSSGAIGQTGGEKTHILTPEELPAHSHGSVYSQHATGTKDKAWYSTAGSSVAYGPVSTGGGAAHNNMPPYIQVSVWRRTA